MSEPDSKPVLRRTVLLDRRQRATVAGALRYWLSFSLLQDRPGYLDEAGRNAGPPLSDEEIRIVLQSLE